MLSRLVIFALIAGVLCAGCRGDTRCVEGSVESCPCPDGSTSTQTCGAEGSFGACECGPDDGPGETNECGGLQDLLLDGEDISPGEPCGPCDDGVVACKGPEALHCVLASEPNDCGGCDALRGAVGDACDGCGGVWACGESGALVCDAVVEPNACGGCSNLGGESPLFTCDVGGTTGVLYCREPDLLVCVGASGNACGGEDSLDELPTLHCGACGKGKWVCETVDSLSCENAGAGTNACGGCAVLPHEPGDSCSCGEWECRGPDAVRCGGLNSCARCGELEGEPGESCGASRIWACSDDGVECVSDDRNACGGTASLTDQPGALCGVCNDGVVYCVAPDVAACAGASAKNACDGCAALAGEPGSSCGYGQVWTCDGTDAVTCEIDPASNACRGGPSSQTPGAECDDCGVYACDVDGTVGCYGKRDTDTDEANCGDCGVACDPGQVCLDGSCSDDRAVEVVTGEAHTCVRHTTGRVSCWGENRDGQLGNGSKADSPEPVEVTNLNDAVSLTAGANHTCAIRETGALVCWGDNFRNQIDGGGGDHEIFVTIVGLQGLSAASAGRWHTCAVDGDAQLWCWGDNGSGQLGDGTDMSSASPVDVALTNVVAVAASVGSTCAADATGAVWCWGDNGRGQLGQGTDGGESLSPVPVSGVSAEQLSATNSSIDFGASHVCAIEPTGALRCWGANGSKEIAATGDAHSPVLVDVSGVTDVAAGGRHTCALSEDGEVLCRGASSLTLGNDGEVGDGTFDGVDRATRVDLGDVSVVDIGSGGAHTCAVTDVGDVYCWGRNDAGQLGDRQTLNRNEPVRVPGIGTPSELGQCTNGVDDDGDGDVDCHDTDCADVLDGSTISGTFVGAPDYFDLSCGTDSARDRAFLWTAEDIGTYQFDTLGSGQGAPAIEVRTGNCSTAAPAVCDANDAGSVVTVQDVRVGDQFVIIVESRGGDSFTLNVTN